MNVSIEEANMEEEQAFIRLLSNTFGVQFTKDWVGLESFGNIVEGLRLQRSFLIRDC
jgi:hypothetical protein